MESSRDHGRGIKPLPPWTTTPAGHNFSQLGAGCFPWPPPVSSSCYTCGYCRREFRSAQALGGHMNVHRRDRARLRQCCSAAHPSSLPSAGGLTAAHHHQHSRAPLPNLNFSPPQHRAGGGSMVATADPVIYSFFSTTTTSASAAAAATNKAAAFEVSLELGIGVCGSGSSGRGGVAVEEDGLDLELRLGCAWE